MKTNMITSALDSAAAAERHGLGHDMIILSAKVSGVRDLLDVYTKLAARCDYPLHLGLTEAGMGAKGLIASTAGLAPLPDQRPIPIWFGAHSAPALRRAGRLADGWFPQVPPGPKLDEARSIVEQAAGLGDPPQQVSGHVIQGPS